MTVKQVIVVRTDLGMGTGKLAAQVAHASLKAYEEASSGARKNWKSGGATKVVLGAESEKQVLDLSNHTRSAGLPNALVRDAGRTQIDSGTLTALGVGPANVEEVDTVTGDLKLL